MLKFKNYIAESKSYKIWNPITKTNEPYKVRGDYKTSLKVPYDLNHPLFKKNMKVDVYVYTRPGEFLIELVNDKYGYAMTLDTYDNEQEFKDDGWKY